MMAMLLRSMDRAPGGWHVRLEYTDAYTDGESRFEERFVAARDDATPDELHALISGVAPPIAPGTEIVHPGETKAATERMLIAPYERWIRWRDTHAEAVARGEPAVMVSALAARATSAWQAYRAILLRWRNAP